MKHIYRPVTLLRGGLSVVREGVLGALDTVGFVPSGHATYLGHSFKYPRESLIGRQIAAGGEWDASLVEIVEEVLPMPAPVVCEVGSNIGASLVQIKRAKPDARIFAFEPSDRFRPFLEKNVALAGLTDVTVSSSLLGRSPGTIALYNNSASASAARPRDPGVLRPRRAQRVPVTTLDAALPTDTTVDLIKVDTDGFDFEVLRGAQATIARESPVLYFEYFPALLESPQTDLAWLQTLGYETFFCFDPSGRFSGRSTNVAQTTRLARLLDYCDILACPRDAPLEAQLTARYA